MELISPTAKIVQRKMLRLDDGLTNGDFKLSDTLITGTYRLRAYTNWMRNFGDNFIFEKSIRLVGGLGGAPGASTIPASKDKKPKSAPLPKTNPDTLPVVRFFPEGGVLVNGLSTVIGVKAEDENGRSLPASGKVLDNAGEAVASFICDSLGFGVFTLLPDAAQHYQALVNIRHLDRRFILPQVSPTGFNLHVQNKQAVTTVALACDDLTFGKINGQHVYLTVKHGGKTYVRQSHLLGDKNLLIRLDDNLLAEGINCITLSDEKAQPLCERLVYIHHALSTILSVSTDKRIYQPKQEATVHFKLNMPGVAHLSLAAVDMLTVPVQPENIVSYLELQSEVRGHIEQAAKYFDTTNVNRFKQLDLLLLTQGWHGFVWKRMEDTTLTFDREVEQGITVTGRVRKVWTDKPVANIHISVHAPKAEGTKFFETNTDSTGRFAIYGPVFYGYQYLNFSARNFNGKQKGKDNSGGWLKVDSLGGDILPVNLANNYMRDTLPSPEEMMIKMGIPKKQQLKEVKIIGGSDKFLPVFHSVTQADQKEYGTVRQYLLYNIEGARIAVSPDGSSSGLVIGPGNPLIISSAYADGSKIDRYLLDGQSPLDCPISELISWKIQKRFSMSGILTLVSLKIRPGAFDKKDYFDNTTANMIGYYKARVFYKPKFGEIDDKLDPRFNTIHWEPNITTNTNGEATISFFNTPNKGNIRIIAQGVTESGTPVMATATYQVK